MEFEALPLEALRTVLLDKAYQDLQVANNGYLTKYCLQQLEIAADLSHLNAIDHTPLLEAIYTYEDEVIKKLEELSRIGPSSSEALATDLSNLRSRRLRRPPSTLYYPEEDRTSEEPRSWLYWSSNYETEDLERYLQSQLERAEHQGIQISNLILSFSKIPQAKISWDCIFGRFPLLVEFKLILGVRRAELRADFGANLILEALSRLCPKLKCLHLELHATTPESSSTKKSRRKLFKITKTPYDDETTGTKAPVFGPTFDILDIALRRWYFSNGGLNKLSLECVTPIEGEEGFFNDRFYKAVGTYCPALQVAGWRGVWLEQNGGVFVKGEHSASSETLVKYFSHLPLTSLRIDSNELNLYGTSDRLRALVPYTRPHLRTLIFEHATDMWWNVDRDSEDQRKDWDPPAFDDLISKCPELRDFFVMYEDDSDFGRDVVSDESLVSLQRHCPKLQLISVRPYENSQDRPTLRKLTNAGIAALGNMPELRYANFDDLPIGVTANGLAGFFQGCKSERVILSFHIRSWMSYSFKKIEKLMKELHRQMGQVRVAPAEQMRRKTTLLFNYGNSASCCNGMESIHRWLSKRRSNFQSKDESSSSERKGKVGKEGKVIFEITDLPSEDCEGFTAYYSTDDELESSDVFRAFSETFYDI